MPGQTALFQREDIPTDLLEFFEPAECRRCYVCHIVQIFREVRRVLRDDGTLWLNLGDSMLPNKCEAMIPHRVAWALMADGWICRSTIIWHKPNPMPESVKDRPTRAHEYVFLLTKRQTYYYDAEAIREPQAGDGRKRGVICSLARAKRTLRHDGGLSHQDTGFRNKRSVWTIATQPYAGPHFATFPPALVEPCLLAGSRPGDAVLDPFCGAGTVALVCQRYGRDFLGIDLDPRSPELARERLRAAAPLFAPED